MQFKKIPIVFTFDERYLLPAVIAIKSLIDHSFDSTFYDIFILSDGLKNEQKLFISTNLGNKKKYKINWVNLDSNVFNNAPTARNWPKSVYYRLLIPELIKTYDKIIYSDVDVLFQSDLSNIYKINIEKFCWSGIIAEYNKKAVCHQSFPEYKHEYIYMSGFMVMNLKKMRESNLIDTFFKNISQFADRLKMFDLEILNLSCNKIKKIPIKYCVLENIFDGDNFQNTTEYGWLSNYYSDEELISAKNNPSIIHYAGRDVKIWNRNESEIKEPYLKYIKLFRKKYYLLINNFKNIQIGDNDLIGNKFNGHDLHLYLRENGIDSSHLVWNKESKDENTYVIAAEKGDRTRIKKEALEIQSRYCLDSINNPVAYDILYNSIFLNSDIVHFHLINNHIFDIQLLPIISKIKPVVWTLHDPWALGGHCVHHFDCEKWKKQCDDCPYLDEHFKLDKDNSALNFEIKKMAIQNSNFDVIVASKWMKEKVEQSPIFKGKKIHLIPFGVDQDIFKPFINKDLIKMELGIPKDSFVITFRCDYSGFKGMDYIEYIINNLATNKKVYFLALKDKIKTKNERFGFKEFGWVKDDNMLSKIYNASDLFLAPSKADAFGLMVVEAMSCGVLPIVLDGTALPNTINAPDCGISVKRDKEIYTKTVKYFIDHNKERENRSKKCLEFAKEKYDKKKYVNRMIEVYKKVISNNKMSDDGECLLNQLKNYMAVEPKKCSSEWLLSNLISWRYEKKVKDSIIILFYKLDKLIPKKIRIKMKSKLVKFDFVKRYLLK